MSKASLELGGTNWGTKDGNLLAYAQGNESSKFVPREFSFTRGSDIAATRINSSGLIEKYRENLLTYSNDFSTWSKVELNSTLNQADPFGGNTATLITTTGTTFGWIRQQPTNTGVQTISFYVKAGSNTKFTAGLIQSPYPQTTFTLTGNGAKSSNAGVIDSTITSVGNGWYRCSMTYNITSTYEIRFYPNDTINKTIGDSVYIYGFQLEKGLVATSYLESGATTATSGVADNEPRINYAGGTASLLLEPSRTNEIGYSEYLDGWIKNSSPIVTQNYGISPEGVRNSTRFETAVGRLIYDVNTLNADETFSVYMKGSGTLRIQMGNDNFYPSVTSEWVRYEFTTTQAVSTNTNVQIRGNGSAVDVELYGAQYERNSYPTSYIPTYGTSVTRSVDFFDSSADFTNFFGNNQGTIYIETNRRLFKGGVNNDSFIGFRENSSGNYWRIIGRDSQVFVQSIGWGNTQIIHYYYASNPTKYLFKWDGTTISFFVEGSLVGSTTQTATFNPDAFGRTGGGVSMASQEFLNQFTLFPTALSDAECIALTT